MRSVPSLLNNRNLPKVALILTIIIQMEIVIKNICHFVYGILMANCRELSNIHSMIADYDFFCFGRDLAQGE